MKKQDIELGIVKTGENTIDGYIYLRGQAVAELTGNIVNVNDRQFINVFICGDERPKNDKGYEIPNFVINLFETSTGNIIANTTFKEFELNFPMIGFLGKRLVDGEEYKTFRLEASNLALGEDKEKNKKIQNSIDKHIQYHGELIEENDLDYSDEDFEAMRYAFEGADEFYEKFLASKSRINLDKQKNGTFFKPKKKASKPKMSQEQLNSTLRAMKQQGTLENLNIIKKEVVNNYSFSQEQRKVLNEAYEQLKKTVSNEVPF